MKAVLILCGWWGALIALAALMADGRWQMAKSKAGKVWFWLTCHRDCAWCKRRVHRAIWPREFELRPGVRTPGISHTICESCLGKVLQEVTEKTEKTRQIPYGTREQILQAVFTPLNRNM